MRIFSITTGSSMQAMILMSMLNTRFRRGGHVEVGCILAAAKGPWVVSAGHNHCERMSAFWLTLQPGASISDLSVRSDVDCYRLIDSTCITCRRERKRPKAPLCSKILLRAMPVTIAAQRCLNAKAPRICAGSNQELTQSRNLFTIGL
jgi:hypothetical protein